MNSVESTGQYYVRDYRVIAIKSPITCPRSEEEFMKANGKQIKIDDVVHNILGIEMRQPGYDIYVGEPLGILVGEVEQ